jgi:hypothetical protein
MISVRFYRIYDIGKEIDLNRLEQALARSYFTARASFQRIRPKSIIMEDPPLSLRLHPVRIERDGRQFDLEVFARVYDIGAISLCFIFEDRLSPLSALEDLGVLFTGQEGLDETFDAYVGTLSEILLPHISNLAINHVFFEDYTVFVTDHLDESLDPVVLMLGERVSNLSPQMREEVLKNALSYSMDDRVILSWDRALICEPGPATDLIDLIEYATVQVLELRYYDRELSRQMEKMYDDIELADKQISFLRMRRYHALMSTLMETYAEISEITEKVNNLIKVTEDVYYARVYALVLKVLRSGQWSESVSRKIEVIQENYSMLSDEVRIQHSNFLEWVVIILIGLEFSLGIWQAFR